MRLAALLLAPLGACALFPLGEAECKVADWRDGHNEWDRLMGAAMHRMR
jgi:hypothetical protein